MQDLNNILNSLKIKSVTPVGTKTVHDLTVEGVAHYIDDKGTVHHNSGIVYSASIILNLNKAKLKDSEGNQSGIIVTAKPEKNRFSIPHTVKFHISYNHGMNPYVGLEDYVIREDSWEKYGAGRGKFITDKEYAKLSAEDKKKAYAHPLDPKLFFVFNAAGRNMCSKQSVTPIPLKELFTEKVFTKETLEAIDADVRKEFAYSGYSDISDNVDSLLKEDLGKQE